MMRTDERTAADRMLRGDITPDEYAETLYDRFRDGRPAGAHRFGSAEGDLQPLTRTRAKELGAALHAVITDMTDRRAEELDAELRASIANHLASGSAV